MKNYLQVCLITSVLGISSFSVNTMEKVLANTVNNDPSFEEAIDFDSLSNPNSFPTEAKEFEVSYSLNLSTADKRLSLQNGIPDDATSIWKDSVGEPENNVLKVTLVRF